MGAKTVRVLRRGALRSRGRNGTMDQVALESVARQAGDTAHDAVQSRRNFEVAGVLKELLAILAVPLHADAKGAFNRGSGAREKDGVAARSHRIHGEALAAKPALDLGEVRVRNAELRSKLRRREPLMVAGRRWVLLVEQQLVERRLLRRRGREHQRHAGQRGVARESSQGRCGCGTAGDRSGELHPVGVTDLTGDPRRRLDGIRARTQRHSTRQNSDDCLQQLIHGASYLMTISSDGPRDRGRLAPAHPNRCRPSTHDIDAHLRNKFCGRRRSLYVRLVAPPRVV